MRSVRSLSEVLKVRPSALLGYKGTALQKLFFDMQVMSVEPLKEGELVETVGTRKEMRMSLRDYLLQKYGKYIV